MVTMPNEPEVPQRLPFHHSTRTLSRRGLIQLAWRFLRFQKDSALAQWYRTRTEGAKGARKTSLIVALARKLLIALWRLVTIGEVPQGIVLRQAA